uniref:Uncharacterized protein n=1 Tax=Meloidogyne enterolobii TaxID=390850 RepID=A0A6V7TRC4_MELEN|nr:unnamed protein product [Meloidogyne enterolobii]
MDEWAPYRMAFLLILVASSVALWASYKLLCEHPDDNEELQQRVIAYQPLRQNCNQLVLSLEGAEGGGRRGGGGGHEDDQLTKNSLSFSSSSSSFDDDEDDDLTCLLIVDGGEITRTKLTAASPTAASTRLKKGSRNYKIKMSTHQHHQIITTTTTTNNNNKKNDLYIKNLKNIKYFFLNNICCYE